MEMETEMREATTYQAALKRSNQLEEALKKTPEDFRVVSGDRPTGRLHIGHLFGSLQNRVRLQALGLPLFIIIADYQVLTDRDCAEGIAESVLQITMDYMATGLDPDKERTCIFPHSYVPELNQLLVPFLTLVTNAELNRNPTVKDEIKLSHQAQINAGMYTYPVHQAADILAFNANLIPVGKDQLPHLEMARTIARRFNERFQPGRPTFAEPQALLSKSPLIKGLDGARKMSKSLGNAIELSASQDETVRMIKAARTDSTRFIDYDPENRPEVANLLLLLSLCEGREPAELAAEIGDSGAGKLKSQLAESLNETLRPVRAKRRELEKDRQYVRSVLHRGIEQARSVAAETLSEVRRAMGMEI